MLSSYYRLLSAFATFSEWKIWCEEWVQLEGLQHLYRSREARYRPKVLWLGGKPLYVDELCRHNLEKNINVLNPGIILYERTARKSIVAAWICRRINDKIYISEFKFTRRISEGLRRIRILIPFSNFECGQHCLLIRNNKKIPLTSPDKKNLDFKLRMMYWLKNPKQNFWWIFFCYFLERKW